MPVAYPIIRGDERDVRNRIKAKYAAYRLRCIEDDNLANAQKVGERYEILAAIELYNRNKFTDGNQLSRWDTPLSRNQSIKIGHNTEIDAVIPNVSLFPNFTLAMKNVNGPILVEFKSYQQGIGPYIKRLAGYCLNDTTLGGFFIVSPQQSVNLFKLMIQNVYTVLADPQQTPAITGGAQWSNRVATPHRPAGNVTRAHFNQYQDLQTLQVRKNRTPSQINNELANNAGFIIGCYTVPNADDMILSQRILYM